MTHLVKISEAHNGTFATHDVETDFMRLTRAIAYLLPVPGVAGTQMFTPYRRCRFV
jgi:hypothetical protein